MPEETLDRPYMMLNQSCINSKPKLKPTQKKNQLIEKDEANPQAILNNLKNKPKQTQTNPTSSRNIPSDSKMKPTNPNAHT